MQRQPRPQGASRDRTDAPPLAKRPPFARPPSIVRPHYLSPVPPEPADPLSQIATVNLTVALELRATAWKLAEAGLRTFRPELDEDAVQAQVRALFRQAAG